MTLKLDKSDVAQAAAHIEAAGSKAASCDAGGDLAGVSGALPGSKSGPAASSFGHALTSDCRNWGKAARSQGSAMEFASNHIDATDSAVGRRFGKVES